MIIMYMLCTSLEVTKNIILHSWKSLMWLWHLRSGDHAWANKSIQTMCTNIGVVEVLTFGRARNPIMAICARNVWLLAAMFNVNIIVSHIKGLDNSVADLLSRWHLTADNFQKLHTFIETPIWVNTHINLPCISDSQVATLHLLPRLAGGCNLPILHLLGTKGFPYL